MSASSATEHSEASTSSRRRCRSASLRSYVRWRPTSTDELSQAETKVLSVLNTPFTTFGIQTPYGKLWTLKMESLNKSPHKRTPLVLLHGMGAGIGIWVMNLDGLSKEREVYAIDLLGFGRSSRPDFPVSVEGVEEQYVSSLETWRKEVGLDKFILLGHSFGGYLSTCYALQYPQNLTHLVLADPWGFSVRPEEEMEIPMRYKVIIKMLEPFNIFSGLRAAGPLGPKLLHKIRPDIKAKFADRLGDEDAVPDYIYHCNVQHPSGEVAFKTLHAGMGFAKLPMLLRIYKVRESLPISFIYGAQSWMEPLVGSKVQEIRKDASGPVNVDLILKSGHHVYADDPDEFNDLVNKECRKYDQ